jgi:hypothetical protein
MTGTDANGRVVLFAVENHPVRGCVSQLNHAACRALGLRRNGGRQCAPGWPATGRGSTMPVVSGLGRVCVVGAHVCATEAVGTELRLTGLSLPLCPRLSTELRRRADMVPAERVQTRCVFTSTPGAVGTRVRRGSGLGLPRCGWGLFLSVCQLPSLPPLRDWHPPGGRTPHSYTPWRQAHT